jgi:hypothetical protein
VYHSWQCREAVTHPGDSALVWATIDLGSRASERVIIGACVVFLFRKLTTLEMIVLEKIHVYRIIEYTASLCPSADACSSPMVPSAEGHALPQSAQFPPLSHPRYQCWMPGGKIGVVSRFVSVQYGD